MKSNINVHQHIRKMLASTKIRYSILFCSLATVASGQVAIGKTSLEGNSTILDFYKNVTVFDGSDVNKGIILPAVEKEPVFAVTPGVPSPNNGTFIFDRTAKKVKVFENNVWKDLSDLGDASQANDNANTSDETASIQGAIIGASTSDAIGVLVLESPDKALILPHVFRPDINVKSPYPGTMVYEPYLIYDGDGNILGADPRHGAIAIFDGVNWNYWGGSISLIDLDGPM